MIISPELIPGKGTDVELSYYPAFNVLLSLRFFLFETPHTTARFIASKDTIGIPSALLSAIVLLTCNLLIICKILILEMK